MFAQTFINNKELSFKQQTNASDDGTVMIVGIHEKESSCNWTGPMSALIGSTTVPCSKVGIPTISTITSTLMALST